jgi:hypothetical protein
MRKDSKRLETLEKSLKDPERSSLLGSEEVKGSWCSVTSNIDKST